MNKKIKLSIVMPCLNEAETLSTCIIKAQSFLKTSQISGEIIIADNGSTDGSLELARKARVKVVQVTERGYGNALMGGFEAAQGEYIIMGDADDSYDFSDLKAFIDALENGYDLVMGNRFQGGIKPGAMPPLHQYLGNPVLSRLGRLFYKIKIGDFHCGMRAFRKDTILGLNLQTTGMEFASEIIVKASMQGLKVAEVPTTFYPDGRSRPPHLRTWADGWRHLRFLLLYSPRWLFYYPGIVLMLIGLIVSAWLLPGPRKIGSSVTLDINTLLYAAFVLILGLQTVLFSLFTRVFGISEGLLPRDNEAEKLLKMVSVEKGLLIGFSLILLGLASSVSAIGYWEGNFFGPIDPVHSMRFVIPGTVLFSVGFQILLSSFFLGILTIKRKS